MLGKPKGEVTCLWMPSQMAGRDGGVTGSSALGTPLPTPQRLPRAPHTLGKAALGSE